jgi:hypothetical protein
VCTSPLFLQLLKAVLEDIVADPLESEVVPFDARGPNDCQVFPKELRYFLSVA